MKTKPVSLALPFLEGLKITITFIYRDLSVCITPLELFFRGSSPWPSSFWVIPTPLAIPAPAKMPDVVVHDTKRNWLLLIEAVTSAGPVDRKRRKELKDLFAGCKAGLVFVTAFSTREVMRSFFDAAFMGDGSVGCRRPGTFDSFQRRAVSRTLSRCDAES